MAQEKRADWETRQARTFEKWACIYLKRAGYNLIGEGQDEGPIDQCFQNGVNLIQLLDALYKGSDFEQKLPKRYNKNPKTQLQRLDNLANAIKMYDSIGIRRVGCTREQLEQGEWKMTLGMMWCMILHANVSLIKDESGQAGKQGLLMWCQKQCEGYKGLEGRPKNFTRNWKDGRVFNALLHRYYPDRVDFDSLDPANAADNIEHAFKNFEEIGVDRLIEVEDMLVDKPDDKQVMCYVSELFKLLSQQDQAKNARDHVINFIQFQRRIQGLCDEYEAGAKGYTAFVDNQIAEWEKKELAGDKSAAQQDIEDFKTYITKVQPDFDVQRIDLETLYANVQTELNAKGMLPWDCPESLQPASLEAANHRLNKGKEEYFDKIREHRFTFIEVKDQKVDENQQKEIEKAFDHFDQDNTAFLEREEFFAAMSAVGVSIPENQQESTFANIAGADDKISRAEYIKYMTSFFDTSDTVDAIQTSMSKLDAGARDFGSPSDHDAVDFAAAGLTGDDLAFIQEKCADGDFDAYVKGKFKSTE